MLVGRPPFETSSLKETYSRITSNKFSVPGHLSVQARNLIHKLLAADPSQRPTLDKILFDEFFWTGYTPKTLSPSCCDTVPKFTHHHTARYVPTTSLPRFLKVVIFMELEDLLLKSNYGKAMLKYHLVSPLQATLLRCASDTSRSYAENYNIAVTVERHEAIDFSGQCLWMSSQDFSANPKQSIFRLLKQLLYLSWQNSVTEIESQEFLEQAL